jgi:hypothetical protein
MQYGANPWLERRDDGKVSEDHVVMKRGDDSFLWLRV